ncbi:MAG: hypothetical protein RSD57_12425 [Comamonas sp.]
MGQLVLAFHGCDISTRDALIRGDLHTLDHSTNPYDWLGTGIYFFLSDHERALKLAKFVSENPSRMLTKRPIISPAVIGCVLDIDRWLDLTSEAGRRNFVAAARSLHSAAETAAKVADRELALPKNRPAFDGDTDIIYRAYDCAVCNMIHAIRKGECEKAMLAGDTKKMLGTLPYQATVSAFNQGNPIDGSAICDGSHTQVAVHDDSCIRGWFLLRGDKLLADDQYLLAKQSVATAMELRSKSKKRVLAPSS